MPPSCASMPSKMTMVGSTIVVLLLAGCTSQEKPGLSLDQQVKKAYSISDSGLRARNSPWVAVPSATLASAPARSMLSARTPTP